MAALGLRRCVWLSPAAMSRDYSALWREGFSLLLLRSTGPRASRLSCSAVWGSSRRGLSRVPCVGRRILNHWTTREAPLFILMQHLNTK